MVKTRFWRTSLLLLLIGSTACSSTRSPAPVLSPSQTQIPTQSLTETPQPSPESNKIPVIYDDDGSPDGTTALIYLLNLPKVELKSISISYGEAHPAVYIQHLGRKLDALGIDTIPLGYGQDGPVTGDYEFPEGVRQSANEFWGFYIPNAEKTYPVQPAADLMVETIQGSPTPVTIFISGPLTNLAQALQLDPTITQNIKTVFIMGGAVNVPGNIFDFLPDSGNKVAEWNIFADSHAASQVFESGIDLNLIPLDATNQVLISRLDIDQWRRGGASADFAAEIYDSLLNAWNTHEAPIWDLMTAVIMSNPDLCEFQPFHLKVVTDAGVTYGQTATEPGEQPNVNVCLSPQQDLIRQELSEVFSGERTTGSIETITPTSLPSSTPVSQIFRDDFSLQLQPGWTWQDEVPNRWGFTSDGWLQIKGEDASLLRDGHQSNLLCRAAPESDFQITLQVFANPNQNFQQITLYLYQDGNNYIALNRGFCGPCVQGGNGLFMEYKLGYSWDSFIFPIQQNQVALRLVQQDQTITGYYAVEPDIWLRMGKLSNYLAKANICLGVSNVDSAGIDADLTGKFDYIDISKP